MNAPQLWFCGYGYGKHVSLDVLETILDREGVRRGVRDIVRDTYPPLSKNDSRRTSTQKEKK